MAYDYGVKRTEKEASEQVDDYVEPRPCFITYIGTKFGWQAYSTTGDTPCAHYVSHILGLKRSNGVVCRLGYLCRVTDVVAALGDPIAASDVKVGDVWARLKGSRSGGATEPSTHCGMVSKVVAKAQGAPSITIKHCSSGQRMVAEDDWGKHFSGGGQFYRLPAREVKAETHVNIEDLKRGFGYRGTMFG